MEQMINDYARFDLRKISDDIIAKYGEKSIGEQYSELYKNL
jgi:hypothetical protein